MVIYLYKKTHNKTGIQYLGKTEQNPFKYKGSGKYWKHHLKVHGNNVTTEIIGEYQSSQQLKEAGLYYSNLWNVIKSKEWANLKEECGDGGSYIGYKHSSEQKLKISQSKKDKKRPDIAEKNKLRKGIKRGKNKNPTKPFSNITKINMSMGHIGLKHKPETIQKMKTIQRLKDPNTHKFISHYISHPPATQA